MEPEKLTAFHRLWRAIPAAPRRAALHSLATLAAPSADATPPATSNGLVVGGAFSLTTGVAEAARVKADAAASLGVLRGRIDMGIGRRPIGEAPPGAALLLEINAPSLPLMLARAGKSFLRHRRVIGGWAWELPVAPPDWAQAARYVHEVWACSRFTADALEPLFPGHVRAVPHPLALRPLAPVQETRADLGLPEHATITTLVLSLGSSLTRKNPLAAMQAFTNAFGTRADQLLVIKLSGEAAFPKEAALITAALTPNMRLLTGAWPPTRVEALIALSDIIISLHRSEGFGLVPAQAMRRAIPVIATAFSGNMDYMDATSAALVDYHLIPAADPSQIYEPIQGALWAEPNLDHAVHHLRHLGENPTARATLGAAGQAYAQHALNGDALRAALIANGIK